MIPPLSEEGALFMGSEEMAPGVLGYAIKVGKEVHIPAIQAVTPGMGHVSKFLDDLDPCCCIVNVCSQLLMKMLKKKGWKPTYEEDGIDVWRKT